LRLLVENYGDARIFVERPFGYKRYIVEWPDSTQMFSGLWYTEQKVREFVEKRLHFAKGE
jgi:hypothetical protein